VNWTLKFTNIAIEDYAHLTQTGVERFGDNRTVAYTEQLDKDLNMFTAHPYAGRVSEFGNKGARVFPSQSHVIYYDALEDAKTVLILAILHKSQDPARRFKREFGP